MASAGGSVVHREAAGILVRRLQNTNRQQVSHRAPLHTQLTIDIDGAEFELAQSDHTPARKDRLKALAIGAAGAQDHQLERTSKRASSSSEATPDMGRRGDGQVLDGTSPCASRSGWFDWPCHERPFDCTVAKASLR